MKNPIFGTFTYKLKTFNLVSISNGLFEALESGLDFNVLPPRSASVSLVTC